MEISNLKDKKVLVLGLSTTGFAAAKFLIRTGAKCFLSDGNTLGEENRSKAELLEKSGVKLEFGNHTKEFIQGAEFCVLSPSIPPDSHVLSMLDELKIPYFSDIELVHRVKPADTKIVAVTGTNGKTTTTMLVSHILGQKFTAPATGNVGVSPLDYLCPGEYGVSEIAALSDKEPDFLVIEASSYQLHYTKCFAPDIAVFCNLTPDHIAWHGGIDNYFLDKAKMFSRMWQNAHSILNYDDERVRNIQTGANRHYFRLNTPGGKDDAYIKGDMVYYGGEALISVSDVPIVGAHNLQNVMCAVIVAKNAGLSNEDICAGIKSFKAPKHRCELIIKKNGIAYYNDSKATNPEAAIVAIGAFEGKRTVLIAGGRDKNTSLDEFCALVKKTIDKVVLIGEAAERFAAELKGVGYNNIVFAKTLEEAIDAAEADKPDVVLFSPACASFDMFKNYETRGEAFRNYVSKV